VCFDLLTSKASKSLNKLNTTSLDCISFPCTRPTLLEHLFCLVVLAVLLALNVHLPTSNSDSVHQSKLLVRDFPNQLLLSLIKHPSNHKSFKFHFHHHYRTTCFPIFSFFHCSSFHRPRTKITLDLLAFHFTQLSHSIILMLSI